MENTLCIILYTPITEVICVILSNLRIGETGRVVSINGNIKLKKRLMALGCIQGTLIKYKCNSPFGDPIIINFRGFNLAIRKKDASKIVVCSRGEN